MNDVYICYLIELDGEKRKTVFTFIGGVDHGEACSLAGMAMDAATDSTGKAYDYFVESLPYANRRNAGELLKMVRDVC